MRQWSQAALELRCLEVRLGAARLACAAEEEGGSEACAQARGLYRIALLALREQIQAVLDELGGG